MKKIMQIVPMLMFMAIGAFCGIFMAEHLDDILGEGIPLHIRLLKLCWMIVCLYGGMILQIIIHEGGHLIFGLLTGYQFSSFRVFSFMFLKENGKFTVKRLSLAGTGGQCLMSPPELEDGRMPYLLYNAGGVLVNLISAFLFLGCAWLMRGLPAIALLFQILAVVGIGYAIVNGLPMRSGNVSNDGYNMFSLGRNTEAIKAFWIQMRINEEIAKGKRLREMPEEWFLMPTEEARKNEMVAALAVFHCNRLMDQKKFSEAKEKIEFLLAEDNGIIDIYKCLMRCDLISISAMSETEIEEKWLDKKQKKFMKSMKNFPSVIRTQYIYELLVKKDQEAAEKKKQQFEKMALTYPYPADIQSERELMEMAEQIAAERNN